MTSNTASCVISSDGFEPSVSWLRDQLISYSASGMDYDTLGINFTRIGDDQFKVEARAKESFDLLGIHEVCYRHGLKVLKKP